MIQSMCSTKEILLLASEKSAAGIIRYGIARSQAMIEQYYDLLERIFKARFDANFNVTLSERLINQSQGLIIVAIDDSNKVVGGARIIRSKPESPCRLPLESSKVVLSKLFPKLQLNHKIYAEWGRFVRDPEQPRNACIAENIACIAVTIATKLGCEYLFAMPNIFMRSRYEEIFQKMGHEFKEMLPVANMPRHITFPTIPVYIAATYLSPYKTSLMTFLLKDQQIYDLCA